MVLVVVVAGSRVGGGCTSAHILTLTVPARSCVVIRGCYTCFATLGEREMPRHANASVEGHSAVPLDFKRTKKNLPYFLKF